jgi:hypothetical protein
MNDRKGIHGTLSLRKRLGQIRRTKVWTLYISHLILIFVLDIDAAHPLSLNEIQQKNRDEYGNLDHEQKALLAAEHQAEKEIAKKIPRVTARSRIQDVSNVVKNMTMLVCLRTFSHSLAAYITSFRVLMHALELKGFSVS